MAAPAPSPLLSIISVTEDADGADFCTTATSLSPATGHDAAIEWLVVPGRPWSPPAGMTPAPRVLPPESNGIYAAMNAGLNQARGTYVWFLNGGDTLASADALVALLDLLRLAQPDMVYADTLERAPDGTCWRKPARDPSCIAHGLFTHHQSIIYRRHSKQRYDTRYGLAADYDFTIAHLATAASIARLPVPLAVIQIGGRSMRQPWLGQREQRAIRRARLGIGWLTELPITMRQSASLLLRRLAPGLWRRLRGG